MRFRLTESCWSPQQNAALRDVTKWQRSRDQVFRLFGYAGTGKTELAWRHQIVDLREPPIMWIGDYATWPEPDQQAAR